MEPEGSSPPSQVTATCPYPEPDQSSSCLSIPLLEDPLYYSRVIYAEVFQVVSFPQASPPKPCLHLSCATCRAHLIRLDFTTQIIFGEQYR